MADTDTVDAPVQDTTDGPWSLFAEKQPWEMFAEPEKGSLAASLQTPLPTQAQLPQGLTIPGEEYKAGSDQKGEETIPGMAGYLIQAPMDLIEKGVGQAAHLGEMAMQPFKPAYEQQEGPRSAQELTDVFKTPVVNLPRINIPASIPAALINQPNQFGQMPKRQITEQEAQPIADAMSGGIEGAESILEGFTSPEGMALLGTGGLGEAAQRLIALEFSQQMASQVPEIARQLGEEFGKPEGQRDTSKISKLLVQGGANTILPALMTKYGILGSEKASLSRPPRPAELPATIQTPPAPENAPTVQQRAAAAIPEALKQQEGVTDASRIRENERQVPQPGIEPVSSEGKGSPNLEQPASGQPSGATPSRETPVTEKGSEGVLLSPQKIADNLGMRFDSEHSGYWNFTLFDKEGKESTSITVKAGSTPEQVMAKYESKRAQYGNQEDSPRPAKSDIPNRNKLIQVEGPDGNKHWFTMDGYQDFGEDFTSEKSGKKLGVQPQLTAVFESPGEGFIKGGTTYGYRLEENGYKVPEKLPTQEEVTAHRQKSIADEEAAADRAAQASKVKPAPLPTEPTLTHVQALDEHGTPLTATDALINKLGDVSPDWIEKTFDRLIEKTKPGTDWMGQTSMGLAKVPVWLTQEAATLALRAGKLAYTSSRDIAKAIAAGVEHLRGMGLKGFDEAQARDWMAKSLDAPKLPEFKDNYIKPLKTYTPNLFRETSLDLAQQYFPNTRTSSPINEHFVSNTENLARGQGSNKGVMLQFDSGELNGQVNTSKPAWKVAYDNGESEFIIKNATPSEVGKNLKSITIKGDAKGSRVGNLILKERLAELEKMGWKKSKTKSGIKWTRPETTPVVHAPMAKSLGGDSDIYGVAARVREERSKAGQVAPVEPGQGISAPDSVEHGRELLSTGSDPEKALSNFEKTKRLSSDDMALVRAKGEELAKSARDIEQKFGTDSKEYKAAWKALSDWDARTKPMQTEWHKTGQAQQGETDLDTGSFTGLQRAYKSDTGKDFTPKQSKQANETATKVNKATTESSAAEQKLSQQLQDDISKRNSLSDAEKKAENKVWEKVKEYIDKGEDDFNDMRNKVATDLGISVNKVTELLSRSKRTKYLADDVWKKQQAVRLVKEQAKRWLKQAAIPAYQRAISSVPKVLFGLKVGFHGTVALGTHAPMVAFQPRFWNTYVTDFGKMYRMIGNPAYQEMQMQDLVRRPNYITARRAGLVNDPHQFEDYNSPDVAKYIGRLSGMGNRGYSVLKILRQDMFDQHWNNLPKTSRIPEVAKAIADGVNHATGVVKGSAPKGTHIALFAPRLEASRVMWLAGDPAKAVSTFSRWNTATEGEKTFAINQVKEKAWVAGTLFGLLALNQGMLSAMGSKQKVNMTDPMHSDWLKFKAGGMTASYGNAMLTMARLPVRLYSIRESSGGKLKNLIYPDEDTYSVMGEYGRSQLSPFASLVSTLWLKGDWQNRPLPSSNRPVPKRLRAQGIKPYTWTEFASEQVAPIPVEEALKEVWKTGMGMTDEQVASMRKAMATLAVMSATGARLTDDVPYKKNNQNSYFNYFH